MAIAALVLFGTFVLLTGVRAVIQRHHTGDTGVRHSSLLLGSGQWWAHWVLNLGTLAAGVVAPVAGLSGLRPPAILDHPVVRVTGVVLAALGVLAIFAAQLAMGASWRIGVDETERAGLVTHGPFRLVRNPIFSAVIAAFLGLTLMVPNAVALTGFLILLAGIELQVRLVEEPYLHRTHAAAYDDYAARVGRFVPGIGRRHRLRGG